MILLPQGIMILLTAVFWDCNKYNYKNHFMKRILITCFVLAALVACNGSSKDEPKKDEVKDETKKSPGSGKKKTVIPKRKVTKEFKRGEKG